MSASAAPSLTGSDDPSPAPPPPLSPSSPPDTIQWTVGTVFASIGLFLLAGLAEIGGGWLVWQTIRNAKPWYYALGGFLVLMAYGVIPTLQPEGATFGRTYAVYGGVFIALSYAWSWAVDGDRPDTGDWVGAAVAVTGVVLAWFWPRG